MKLLQNAIIIILASIITVSCAHQTPETIELRPLDPDGPTIQFNTTDTVNIISILMLQEQGILRSYDLKNENHEDPSPEEKKSKQILEQNEASYKEAYGEDWHETLEKALKEDENTTQAHKSKYENTL